MEVGAFKFMSFSCCTLVLDDGCNEDTYNSRWFALFIVE